jgi:hypothetical protein
MGGFERLTANAKDATVLGPIPASSDTVGIRGIADEAVLNTVHAKKKLKNPRVLQFQCWVTGVSIFYCLYPQRMY